MTQTLLRDLRASDYIEFQRNIDPEDAAELAAQGATPWTAFEDALWSARNGGMIKALVVNGELVAIGGLCAPLRSDSPLHTLWLLCTKAVKRYPKASFRVVKAFVASAKDIPCWNATYAASHTHHRLIEHAGLNLNKGEVHTVNGNPFYVFTNW